MTVRSRPAVTALAGLTVGAIALTGCSSGETAAPGPDDKIKVVASTSVWGSVAQAVGGDAVEVESIINDASADPHSYESSPQDAAKISDANLVVLNGGGYDEFMTQVLGDNPKPTVQAVDSEQEKPAPPEGEHAGEPHAGEQPAGEHAGEPHAGEPHAGEPHAGEQPAGEPHAGEPHADEHAGEQPAPPQGEPHAGEHAGHDHSVNEHVWYDLHAVHEVADKVAAELGKMQPAKAQQFEANAAAFEQQVAGLEGRVGEIAAAHQGKPVIVTEPVAHYMVEAAKLNDVTPPSFVNAIEAETDPSAAAVADIQNAINARQAVAVIYNPQTESPVTRNVRTAADSQRIPVVEMTETLPQGQSYVQWMDAQITALQGALNR
ncbi:metal ABC transporter solute-binding protein, Zn/Mn family [Saccharopolyspora endophytica]|uniref:Zinc ABC transporter substrate-binding protein n=1 Tax=Saccharopolyspora endophytica TaxID=543886 RepID=A0ABS5DNW3_9PSEU|nr:zinc ABC transporter substrate-binding protein [Saccharopolyspora endophytica]MBQ0927991.1 zinc ABC transporter substrate-binding protein [Saccharopolyspora endophytica]